MGELKANYAYPRFFIYIDFALNRSLPVRSTLD